MAELTAPFQIGEMRLLSIFGGVWSKTDTELPVVFVGSRANLDRDHISNPESRSDACCNENWVRPTQAQETSDHCDILTTAKAEPSSRHLLLENS